MKLSLCVRDIKLHIHISFQLSMLYGFQDTSAQKVNFSPKIW